MSAIREVDRQPSQSVEVLTGSFLQSQYQIESALPLQDLRNRDTIHGCFDEFVDICHAQSVQQQLIAIQFDAELGDDRLLFHDQVLHTGDACDLGFDLVGSFSQLVEIIPKDLDPDLCLHT